MRTVEILSEAEEDLVEAFHFYEKQERGVGDHFLVTLFAEIDCLAVDAGIHKIVWGRYRKLSEVFPFGIFYTINENAVQVRAVLDLRQEPAWVRRRMTEED